MRCDPKRPIAALLLMLFAGAAASAPPLAAMLASPLDETILAHALAQRQDLIEHHAERLAALAPTIKSAAAEAQVLIDRGDFKAARLRLAQIDPNTPLEDLPSTVVLMELAGIAHAEHDNPGEALYLAHARARAEILLHRIGGGNSPDDPLRIDAVNEISDWADCVGGELKDLKTIDTAHGQVLGASVAHPGATSATALVYFQVAPQLAAQMQKANDPFRPVAPEAMTPELRASYERVGRERQAFIADRSFNFLDLSKAVSSAMGEADRLAKAGNIKGALDRLNQLSNMRPLDHIPMSNLWSMRVALLGASDEREALAEAKIELYGIIQSLAHSGDALSRNSAIKVIAVPEEYFWIGAKQLKLRKQTLVNADGKSFDVMTCADANGAVRDYFFDITDVFARESASLK